MQDLISRQAAIDVARKCSVKEVTPAYMLIDKAEVMTELMMLPSAQPQPCEDDPRADVYYLAEKIGIHRLYALVVELRGEPEPCKDAVRRKESQ